MISIVLTLLMLGILAIGLGIRRRSPPVALCIMLLALGGAWFAWRPQDLTSLAHHLGVGRGADLALYLGLSLAFLALAAMLVQLRFLHARTTELARELALLRAREEWAQRRNGEPADGVGSQTRAGHSPGDSPC